MPALIFFTSLLALVSLISVSLVRGWSRRSARRASPPRQRKPRGAAASRRGATADSKKRRAAAKVSAAEARKKTAKTAGRKSSTGNTPKRRREWGWPRLPVPPSLVACLPLGLLSTLVAGAGQLALYGLRQGHDIPLDDPRLASLDNALAAISLGALALLLMGLAGWLASRRAG